MVATDHPGRVAPAPDTARLWTLVAEAIEPRELVPPSVWAEANVELTKEQSPHKPGPFSCAWKPWIAPIHDAKHHEPAKRGVIAMKPAQIGFTRTVLNVFGCYCDTRPGPMLFLISDAKQAAHFAAEHWDPMVQKAPRLRELFGKGQEDRREILLEKPYRGGRVDFAGAGSVSSVASRTYVVVGIDEFEIFQDNFPSSAAGSGFTMAEARTQAVEHLAQVWVWSHPRKEGEGIHDLFHRLSDRRAWVFNCPHCEGTIRPQWSMVHFQSTIEGELDPATAVLRCPHCGEVITDQQRARAVWSSAAGGSGRFESDLDPEVASARRYVGLWIHRLVDPDVTVRGLAERFVSKKSDRERMAFYNTVLGEPFTASTAVVTIALVESRIQRVETVSVPGGRDGCQYLTVGGDVQFPPENPTVYLRASAWGTSGVEYVVDLAKLTGWAAVTEYLRSLSVPYTLDGQAVGRLYPRLFSVDCGAFTGQVLDFCRLSITHNDSHSKIPLLPLRYQAHVKSIAPALMPSEEKRIDPRRPHLGAQERYDLHRHTWVDRQMKRLVEGRIVVLCPVPADWSAHCTANVLVPVKDTHGWGNPDLEWAKIKDRSDDWLQCGAFNEAGAALKLKLDRLHEIAHAAEARANRRRENPRPANDDPGFINRARRSGDYWGGRS